MRLPEELVLLIEAEAKRSGETVSQTVRRLLTSALGSRDHATWREAVDQKLDRILILLEGSGAPAASSGKKEDLEFERYVAENAAAFLAAFEKDDGTF